MFHLIWMTLLLSVGCSIVEAAKDCHNGSCITLTETNVTAEVGLCVVLRCSFTTNPNFTLEHLTWHKFPLEENSTDSQIIFNFNKTDPNVQTEYSGRVSLLSDLSTMNCSIIINDLKKSDSGLYHVRVNGSLSGATEEYISSTKVLIKVKALIQKPKVTVPPLTEGQQTTLTCTAPGLCSGSVPTITWTWRGRDNTTQNPGNVTTERNNSTLTFNASAGHHGTQVTCKVNFTGGTTTEETETLNVTYVKELKFVGSTVVEEGLALNLTCSCESFPPSLITWTKLGSNNEIKIMNDTGMAKLVICNMTEKDSGKYICTAIHLEKNQTKEVDVTVKNEKKANITGKTTLKEGDTLNLTCTSSSFPLSVITWAKNGSNKILQNNTGTATLVKHHVTTEQSGQYICTVKHLNNTMIKTVDITVASLPKVLNDSRCVVRSRILTCVCISQGYPLPTIRWPLLKNHTEYSVNITVSNHMVNNTVILTLQNHNYINNNTVECVSSNGNGQTKGNLTIKVIKEPQSQTKTFLSAVARLDIIIAFCIGGFITATFCCLVRKCHRKKKSTHDILDMEMVTNQEAPLIHACEAMGDDQTHDQDVDEEGAAGKSDVEYSHINVSLLKRNNATKGANFQETTETEYAEVKKKGRGEVIKEEEAMIEVDEDRKHVQEKEGEEEALYSSVNDIMDEI